MKTLITIPVVIFVSILLNACSSGHNSTESSKSPTCNAPCGTADLRTNWSTSHIIGIGSTGCYPTTNNNMTITNHGTGTAQLGTLDGDTVIYDSINLTGFTGTCTTGLLLHGGESCTLNAVFSSDCLTNVGNGDGGQFELPFTDGDGSKTLKDATGGGLYWGCMSCG